MLRVIESVEDTLEAVVRAGRYPSRYSRDQRIRDARGRLTDWTESVIQGPPSSVASDEVEGTSDPSGTGNSVRLLVTKKEVSQAIDAIGRASGDAGQSGDPIVDLLVTGVTAIHFKASRQDRSSPEASDTLSGVRALTTLESGFGGGEFRSVTVDLARVDKTVPPVAGARIRDLLASALRKAAGRRMRRLPARPGPVDKGADGPGYG